MTFYDKNWQLDPQRTVDILVKEYPYVIDMTFRFYVTDWNKLDYWCEKNCKEKFTTYQWVYYFKSKEDAMLFRLIWDKGILKQ